MTFPINTTIPNVNNDPFDDCPLIQANFSNISQYVAVDHISAGTSNIAGQHSQVRFPLNNAQGAQTNPASVLYTNAAPGAASTISQLIYRSSNGIFPVSCIKSYGSVTVSGGVPTLQNGFNTSIVRNSVGNYTIALNSGNLTGTYCGVFISSQMIPFGTGSISGYQVASATSINLYFRQLTQSAGTDPAYFSYLVVQY